MYMYICNTCSYHIHVHVHAASNRVFSPQCPQSETWAMRSFSANSSRAKIDRLSVIPAISGHTFSKGGMVS